LITIKIPYKTSENNVSIINDLRRQYSCVVRYAYNRIKEGMTQRDIRLKIKDIKSVTMNSWFIQCAIMEGLAIYKRNKDRKVIFGGKKLFNLRIRNKINKEELRNKRLVYLTLQGEANKNGNRQFNFSYLMDNKLIFKVNSKQHLELNLQLMKKNYMKKLKYIQDISSIKQQPITIKISATDVYFIYVDKQINRGYKPMVNRYMGIDMNPNNIGISIKENDKIIYTNQFNLTNLTSIISNEHNSSESKRFKYLNNKLKHEIIQVSKKIIDIGIYYKVNYVFIENLTGILKSKVEMKLKGTYKGTEYNRKTHNYWKRSLFIDQMKKRCCFYDIKFRERFAHYSSFIGNMMYDYVDSVNASLEIGRRGYETIIKNNKNKFYPNLTKDSLKDQWKEYLSDDVEDWKGLYQKISKLKYRVSLNDTKHQFKVFKMNSTKSKIICHNFI